MGQSAHPWTDGNLTESGEIIIPGIHEIVLLVAFRCLTAFLDSYSLN